LNGERNSLLGLRPAADALLDTVAASGRAIFLMLRALRYLPWAPARRRQIVGHMLVAGVYTLPAASLIAAFTGMVLALQMGAVLADWGQSARIGAIVATSMCREMGPIWVAVILAARVGSAMAAELGTMQVSEEIDALNVMSIDPARFLVMPQIVALMIMAPVLTVYADLVGILGGAVVGNYQFNVPYLAYLHEAERALVGKDILGGVLLKAPLAGLVIAVVGCAIGLAVRPSEGARGVGSAARNSVVVSLILLTMFNYILSSIIQHL